MHDIPASLPLCLPGGQSLPNRIAKAAMEEDMADARRLDRRWGAGGAGLLVTGNAMVAADAVTGPFRAWTREAQAGGARGWRQISHPGHQVFAATNATALAPSAVPQDMGGFSGSSPGRGRWRRRISPAS